jgi:hypothetical protein
MTIAIPKSIIDSIQVLMLFGIGELYTILCMGVH